jgi:hypothetical protein
VSNNFDLTPFNDLMRDATHERRSVLWVALLFGAGLMLFGLWDFSIGWPLSLGGLALFAVGSGAAVRRFQRRRHNARISERARESG